ncbi:MAG: carbohydrate kinase family protein [Anaerolineae bacterium]
MSDGESAQPQVIVIGAACVDTKGRTRTRLVPGTSNPGEIRITVGGVGRNIAESLARLGVPVALITAVGNDDWGRDILRCTRRGGVDVHHVRVCEGERSAAYLAVLDANGERIASVDSTDILKHIDGRYLFDRRQLFARARIVVIDGNLSEQALSSLFRLAERRNLPIALDPTSAVLAERLRRHLPRFHLVTPDVAEAEVLTGMKISDELDAIRAAQALVAAGVKVAIVTMAEQGCCYATSETSGRVPAIRSEIVDPIGAGDALTAAVVFGLLNNCPIDETVRLGVAAATLTLRCQGAVCPHLSLQALYDAMSI